MSDTPEPGLVRVEATAKRPNAVVLNRTTVALTVFAILLFLGLAIALVLDARAEARASRLQSEDNERVVRAVLEQSAINSTLIEQGTDCVIANLGEHRTNTAAASAAEAAHHGYVLEREDVVDVPTDEQELFIADACSRFFSAQAAMNPASPP